EKRDAEKAAKIAEKEKQAAKKKGDKAKLDGFKQADKERIATQAKNLTNKLSFFTNTECDDQAAEAFREKMALEAQELRNAYHGAEHLHAIGYIYSYKARQYLRQKEGWALQSFASSVQDTGHQVKEVYDMVKSGDDINRFCKRMEKVANEELDEEFLEDKYQELAEMAVQIFPKAFWRLSKLDIEDVLRKVCDEVLRGKGIDPTLGRNRAKALKILGDVYQRVAPDTNQLILRPTSKP
ncbi:DnaJ-like protein, partial [Dimargaris verticillata]